VHDQKMTCWPMPPAEHDVLTIRFPAAICFPTAREVFEVSLCGRIRPIFAMAIAATRDNVHEGVLEVPSSFDVLCEKQIGSQDFSFRLTHAKGDLFFRRKLGELVHVYQVVNLWARGNV
jgi:hypothetical protein